MSVEPYCRESSGVDGYRRMESDCSKYYQCVHGKWLERPCAPGTVFNERLSVCDHARNVPECGKWLERPCAPGTVFNERLSVCDHARNVPECGGY
ncbi:chitin binding Peritrophin-A domain protein [Cooperia oncophora]